MTSQSSAYFQKELKVFVQAEAILAIRREIIRLQADREKLREAMRGLDANPKQHRVFESCNISSGNSGTLFFVESTRDETLSFIHSERKRLDKELLALEQQRKELLRKLIDLKPETSAMSPADLKFLLKDVKSNTSHENDDEIGRAHV